MLAIIVALKLATILILAWAFCSPRRDLSHRSAVLGRLRHRRRPYPSRPAVPDR